MAIDAKADIFRFQYWTTALTEDHKDVTEDEKCFSCKRVLKTRGVQDLHFKNRDYCLKCAILFGIWE